MGFSMRPSGWYTARALVIGGSLLLLACGGPRPGGGQDEASRAGRVADSFAPADEDYFRDMDVGTGPLTREEVIGRNMWLVWTGGNDRFWDRVIPYTFGNFDL